MLQFSGIKLSNSAEKSNKNRLWMVQSLFFVLVVPKTTPGYAGGKIIAYSEE